MAYDTDFLMLYRELGVGPECAPDEFRMAYRRRVAELHPDRQGVAAADTHGLQRLNALYEAAVQFQRQHGRLPGTMRSANTRLQASPAPGRATSNPGSSRHRGILFLLIVVLVAIAIASWGDHEPTADVQSGPSDLSSYTTEAPTLPLPRPRLHLGMTVDDVRVIEGDPVIASETLWEFGPSWIAFECGLVSNWYSSPLRPLSVDARHPAHDATPNNPQKKCQAPLPAMPSHANQAMLGLVIAAV